MKLIEREYKKLGELMFQARIKKNLTTHELCQEFKKHGLIMQRTSITHIECGSQRIMLHYLGVISKVLDIKISDLVKIFVEVEK
mgnify:CR=1 FL=1